MALSPSQPAPSIGVLWARRILVFVSVLWMGASLYRIGLAPLEAERAIRIELEGQGQTIAEVDPETLAKDRQERTAANRTSGGVSMAIGFVVLIFAVLLPRFATPRRDSSGADADTPSDPAAESTTP